MCSLIMHTLIFLVLIVWIGIVRSESCEANDLRAVMIRLRELATKTNASISRLEKEIKALQEENADLRQRMSNTNTNGTLFTTSEISNADLASGVLLFGVAKSNSNDVYNTATGKFTAPASGTYLFMVQICARYSDSWFEYYINSTTGVLSGVQHFDTCTSISAVAALESSAEVWVEMGTKSSPQSPTFYGYPWTLFTGILSS